MPKGYLIAHVRVRGGAGFERFRTLSSDAISQHFGRVFVNGGVKTGHAAE